MNTLKKYLRIKRLFSASLVIGLLFSCTGVVSGSQVVENTNVKTMQLDSLPHNIQDLLPDNSQNDKIYLTSEKAAVDEEINPAELYTIRTEDASTGEGTLFVHSVPVKFINKKGQVQFIDTSMKTVSTLKRVFSNYSYCNASNSFLVEFGDTLEKGLRFNKAFTLEKTQEKTQENLAEKRADVKTEQGHGTIVYPNGFGPGTRVEYVNTESGVKENIVLDRYIGRNRFDFLFHSKTHIPVLSEDKENIFIVNKENPQNIEYRFLSLYAYDSYDPSTDKTKEKDPTYRHMNEELHYELTKKSDNQYIITVVVPNKYLKHPETVYPVTIDPTITKVSSNSNAEDTYVNAGAPNTNYGNQDYIRFGLVQGKKNFGYHRFTSLPSLPTGASVTSAYLKFTFRSGQTTPAPNSGMKMWTLRVTDFQWNESTITWNNQPYGDYGPFTSITYNGSRLDYFNANITDMVQDWYNGTPNYGIDFTYSDEGYNDYNSVYSSEGNAKKAPVLTVNYSGGGDVYRSMGWSYMFRTPPYSTPYYGMTRGFSPDHIGIDIAAPANTPVYSPTDGTVIVRGEDHHNMGNFVVIRTDSSDSMGNLTIRTMHFISPPPVALNQTVNRNTIIGYVGTTGDSTGNHLHFDVNNMEKWDGKTLRNNFSRCIDPTRFW